MKHIKLVLTIFAVLVLGGCAHPLVISPNISKIEREMETPRIKKNVGYYIADNLRTQEVITPGGGGDKVKYVPYRDLETAFYKMLTNVYENVTKLSSPTETETLNKNNINYVITPEITTNSSSSSAFTWPPTRFSVDLTSKISDPSGKLIDTKKVIGQGQAEFDEFKSDFSLSGKRAAEDALLQMQRKLLEMDKNALLAIPTKTVASKNNFVSVLENLKSLRDRGVITEQEFETKKKDILSQF